MTTLDTVEALDADTARRLTDQIKVTVEGLWHLVVQAYEGRAWTALGYSTWDEYTTREFGTSRIRIPREERSEVVQSLDEAGLTIRAIAAVVGISEPTVRRDLAGASNDAPAEQTASGPSRKVGLDGKVYPTTKVAKAAKALTDAEPERDADDIKAEAEAIAEMADDPVRGAAEAVESRRVPQPVPKRSHAEGVPPHPATYPDAVIDIFRDLIAPGSRVLDPFAGVGGIHQLRPEIDTVGIEIEHEWASVSEHTVCGDSRKARDLVEGLFDVIATSPAYGNRLADNYDASDPEARRSYSIDLGRPVDEGSGAGLHFARDGRYEDLHAEVWEACVDLLRPGGLFLLNCKDFVRNGSPQWVVNWHTSTLIDLGLRVEGIYTLPAAGLPYTTAKPFSEVIVVFSKPFTEGDWSILDDLPIETTATDAEFATSAPVEAPERPWATYDGATVERIIAMLASFTVAERIEGVIAYETANGGRGAILAACAERLAALGVGT